MVQGSMTALVTPFSSSGAIDYESLRRLIEMQIEGGTDVLVPCGTTGESPTLSYEEHDAVIAKTVEYAAGRAKVIAGTGSNSTEEAIYLTQRAKEARADGALVVAPYYNKPGARGLYAHFKAIADAVDIPLILYNIPGRTNVNILPETTAMLVRDTDTIIGMKESTGSLSQAAETIFAVERVAKKPFALISGDDALALPTIAIGGKGVVSALSNAFPKKLKALVSAALEGDYTSARKIHYACLPLIKAIFLETNPIPIKMALYCMGIIASPMTRLPLTEASEETTKALKTILAEEGAL